MRKKKALRNIIFSVLQELAAIIAAFIIPKIIISKFGSEVNGLATSITQFLGYVVLLQSGIGGVIKASLYKPLTTKNLRQVNKIVNATEKFFRKLGAFTIFYIIVLALILSLNNSTFDILYTFLLVLCIGVQTFGEYFFGITYQMVLEADQKQYIFSITQISCVILSTIITVILSYVYPNIHVIKLCASLFFIIRPLILRHIVYKKYKIERIKNVDKNILKNRWDGVGHTLAYFIHNKTDVLVLYLFASLESISIYSIYALISAGLKTTVSTICNPLQATFGNIIAKKESKTLEKRFSQFELITNMASSILFPVGAALAIPFVKMYASDFDSNYVFPAFSLILLLSEFVYCLRLPYHIIIISAGHYKQTRNGAFIEAAINIIASIILVKPLGLLGVAIGTLSAMLYRTIDYIIYLRKNIINRSMSAGFLRIAVSLATFFATYFVLTAIPIEVNGIGSFILAGILFVAISGVICLIVNVLLYRKTISELVKPIAKKITRRKQSSE